MSNMSNISTTAGVATLISALVVAGGCARWRVPPGQRLSAWVVLAVTAASATGLWVLDYGASSGTFFAGLTIFGYLLITIGKPQAPIALQRRLEAAEDAPARRLVQREIYVLIGKLLLLALCLWLIVGMPTIGQ